MKKIAFITALTMMLSAIPVNAAITDISLSGGKLDRKFDANRTLYYVDLGGDYNTIPDITGTNVTQTKKATSATSENLLDRVTIVEDDEGKEYRFVFKAATDAVEITNFAIDGAGNMTVDFNAPYSDTLNVVILKPTAPSAETTWDIKDITKTNGAEKVEKITTVKASAGTFSYKLPASAEFGSYKVVLGGKNIAKDAQASAIAYYVSTEVLNDILVELNKATDADAFINTYGLKLSIDLERYGKVSDKSLFDTYMLGKNFAKIEDGLDAYYLALALSEVSEADEGTVLSKIEANKTVLGADVEGIYKEVEKKAPVAKMVKGAYDTKEKLVESFNKAVATQYINESDPDEIEKRYGDVDEILFTAEQRQAVEDAGDNKDIILSGLLNKGFESPDKVSEKLDALLNPGEGEGSGTGTGSTGSKDKGTSSIPSTVTPFVPSDSKTEEDEDYYEPLPEKVDYDIVFDDLDTVPWAEEAIMLLAERKVINGKGNNKFDPNAYVTREEFAKMVTLGLELVSPGSNMKFDDVPQTAWYYEPIEIAFATGVVKGKTATHFGVGDLITREEMATMIYRAATFGKYLMDDKVLTTHFELPFEDADQISSYAVKGITTLYKAKALSGVSATTFAPKANATRAQAAQMIYNLLKIQVEQEEVE